MTKQTIMASLPHPLCAPKREIERERERVWKVMMLAILIMDRTYEGEKVFTPSLHDYE